MIVSLKTFFILSLLLVSVVNCFSQSEANTWYFENKAGLDFSGGSPLTITKGQLNTTEEYSSMSTESVNLLFYTDGSTVCNSFYGIMTNGIAQHKELSDRKKLTVVYSDGYKLYDFNANTEIIFNQLMLLNKKTTQNHRIILLANN